MRAQMTDIEGLWERLLPKRKRAICERACLMPTLRMKKPERSNMPFKVPTWIARGMFSRMRKLKN